MGQADRPSPPALNTPDLVGIKALQSEIDIRPLLMYSDLELKTGEFVLPRLKQPGAQARRRNARWKWLLLGFYLVYLGQIVLRRYWVRKVGKYRRPLF